MEQRKVLPRVFLITALLAVLVVSCVVFAACGGAKYSIKWELDHATVTVSGFDTAPGEAKKDSEIKFSVTPENGYGNPIVKYKTGESNATPLKATDGFYSFVLTADTTVTVTAAKTISSLTVTSKPTKLTYFHEEALVKTGMVITANYATGDSLVIANDDKDLTVSPAEFAAGDTEFTVSYGGKSEKVQLTRTVEYLVTMDPDGGAMSAAAKTALSGQNNYSIDNSGKITFSYYNNLGSGITLPTESDMTLADNVFKGWKKTGTDGKVTGSAITKITNDTKSNLKLKADWEANLAKIHNVKVENRSDGGKTVSYLVIQGTFIAANEAYLYLYEGNDKVELKGDTVTKGSNDSFELLYDLSKLSDESDATDYSGKWMDIRFRAMLGTREGEMQVYTTDANLSTEVGSRVQSNGYSYVLLQHISAGETSLKICYGKAENYTYSMEFKANSGAKPTLVINGTVLKSEYYNKTMRISWWISSESPKSYGKIGADGKWTVEVNMADVVDLNKIGYAHITVLDSDKGTSEAESAGTLFGGTSTNLESFNCTSTLAPIDPTRNGAAFGEIAEGIRFEDSNHIAYYVGSEWNLGLKLYVRDETWLVKSLTVKTVSGKPSLVVSGTISGNKSILDPLKLDFQNTTDWGYIEVPLKDLLTFNTAAGTFTFTVDLSDLEVGKTYLMHLGFEANNNPNFLVSGSSDTFTIGDKTYEVIDNYKSGSDYWNVTAIKVTAAA